MNNVNILIVEDDQEQASRLKKSLETHNYTIAGIAKNHRDALTLFYQLTVDFVIIDIFLGESSDGIAFAETISTVPNSNKPFIFLTNYIDRNIYNRIKPTRPYRLLVQPFNETELLYAIEMALEKFYGSIRFNTKNISKKEIKTKNEYLYIKKKNCLKKVYVLNIIYIEVDNRYCNIITEKEKFVIQTSLEKISKYLDTNFFQKIHRKYIVNINNIEQIFTSNNLLLLKKNYKVSFSHKYKNILDNLPILK